MISIGVAARQSGLEICTLRKWEERYGFPKPVRLASGQRRYLEREIEQLLGCNRRAARPRNTRVKEGLRCESGIDVPRAIRAAGVQVC